MGRRRGRGRGPARGRRGMGRRGRPARGRRRRGRRMVRGGSVLLMVGGATAAYKYSQKDVEAIEKHTKKSAEEMTEEELLAAMKKLGIKNIELTDEDEDAVDAADGEDEKDDDKPSEQESEAIKQLRQLGELKDAGILTQEEFETKKAEILGRL